MTPVESWRWVGDIPLNEDSVAVKIVASCGDSCTQVAPTITGPPPNGPIFDLCELNNRGGYYTFTSNGPTLTIFDDTWAEGWTVFTDASNPARCSETMLDGQFAQGTTGLSCSMRTSLGQFLYVFNVLSLVNSGDYTHVQFKAKSAPGFGRVNLAVSLSDGKYLQSFNPRYLENGIPIDDTKWTTVTIPLSDIFEVPSPFQVLGLIVFDWINPFEFFLDEIKLVNLVSTFNTNPDFPPVPEIDSNPRSWYTNFHINEAKRVPGDTTVNSNTGTASETSGTANGTVTGTTSKTATGTNVETDENTSISNILASYLILNLLNFI